MSGKENKPEPESTPPTESAGAKKAKGDYEVGYGKPPQHSKFKPGNTAGRGRRTGSKNLKTIVQEAGQAKVPVTIGGQTRKLTRPELAVHHLYNKAGQGDMKAADKMFQLEERYGALDHQSAPPPEKLKRDFKALRDYLTLQRLIDPDYQEEDDE